VGVVFAKVHMNDLLKVLDPYLTGVTLNKSIYQDYLADEKQLIKETLLRDAQDPKKVDEDAIEQLAAELSTAGRQNKASGLNVENFLREYSLGTEEGIAIMCLAEALIRVPDAETAQVFLQDKISQGNWGVHLGHSSSFWINASTWGLVFTEQILKTLPEKGAGIISQLIRRLGGPLIHAALQQAMSLISEQFVSGKTIAQAYRKAQSDGAFCYSFDMLGEAALTESDADNYFRSYYSAIETLSDTPLDHPIRPGISVKLSALHPRFEPWQRDALDAVEERLLELVLFAKSKDIPITLDAEESHRIEPLLHIFTRLFQSPDLSDWSHFGIAVQAYSKRSYSILNYLESLSQKYQKVIPVRLVKGAYWDYEIKKAQQEGLSHYPVFTEKALTDVNYLYLARFLIKRRNCFYAQFGTHNAFTMAYIVDLARVYENSTFEFQRLYGMGSAIYQKLLKTHPDLTCRIYAPVGPHRDLLPYLVRRLLENGANTSFIHQLRNERIPIHELVRNPFSLITSENYIKSFNLPMPRELYLPSRINSGGLNLNSEATTKAIVQKMMPYFTQEYPGKDQDFPIRSPSNKSRMLGSRTLLQPQQCQTAISEAYEFFPVWAATHVKKRSQLLYNLADKIEDARYELMALLMMETGKTLQSAHAEVREAVDFCRYYAQQAVEKLSEPVPLVSPTGEENWLELLGRGVFVCISPWNFPVSIFIGQIAAALVAGNCVIAKPATLGELCARKVASLIIDAGFPREAIHFTPCSVSIFSTLVLSDPRISGVVFTGSLDSAQDINRQLAQRAGSLPVVIAETGGQNAMIVDSTALPEQVATDAIVSAFDCAGQRCSALRVLFIQEEIAHEVIDLISGRMQLLKVGDSVSLDIDVGPVISDTQQQKVLRHIDGMSQTGKILSQTPLPKALLETGFYVPPTLIEIHHLKDLKEEVFGPVLHVIRFKGSQLNDVVRQINEAQYGLTLGIQSRIDSRVKTLTKKLAIGNIYINRNMVGAVVGSQPFGGQGLSGTGPKAGGPHYLLRFVVEKTVSNNTAAIGGNTQLLSLHRA